jgi:hypothetical protein
MVNQKDLQENIFVKSGVEFSKINTLEYHRNNKADAKPSTNARLVTL